MAKQGKQCQTLFLGSKITADCDCSHEIKRRLLLGRKVMKSRDITLPTKVHLVKAMVLPVVMYGCESWTKKKAVGFSRQEYWSGLPFPTPGDLPDPRIEPKYPALRADALTSELPGKPKER